MTKAVLGIVGLALTSGVLDDRCAAEPTTTPTDELTLIPKLPKREPLSPEAIAERSTLAEKLANPLSNLTRLPLRFTYQEGIGPKDAFTLTMLAQPLIPITLNDDWNLIAQTTVPITYVGSVANGVQGELGLGDTIQTFFFSPVAPSRRGWIVGFGPAFQWPTATDDRLGNDKWGVGPAGAVVKQVGGWTYGMVAEHIWSYAGDSDRNDVSTTYLHPIVTYTWPSATSITVESDTFYDWINRQWTVPLQLSISQVVVRGRRPVEISLGGRYFADKPEGGPEWGIRFSVTILFPN